MQHKTFDLVEIKADGEAGEFTALASVFGNVDLVGDRMLPGSFSKTLERWRESGDPIPVVLSHDWDDPMKYVGKADPRAVMETDEGLLVQGTLDIGTGNPVADQTYKLMKQRMLKGWSFGYTVPDGGQKRENGANEVSEVDLIEVGPTLKGANPEAQLQEIKSALKAEKPTEDPEALKKGYDELVIDLMANGIDVDEAKARIEKAEEPEEVKAAEPPEEPLTLLEEIEHLELPQDVKDRLVEKATVLVPATIEDVPGEEPPKAKPQASDPLSKDHDRLQFELTTEGIDMVEPPKVKEQPKDDLPTLEELRRRSDDLMLEILIGSENP